MSSPTGSCASPRASGARTSSRRPTAVSAGASTRRSRGRSSARCRRVRRSPAGSSGAAGSRRRPPIGALRLTTTLQARGPAAAVVLDDEQVAAIGEGAKRFPVAATIGDYTWRTTVTRMGAEFLLGMNKDVRRGAGAEAGDTVDVLIELDEAPREVEVPEALSAALAGDPVAKER